MIVVANKRMWIFFLLYFLCIALVIIFILVWHQSHLPAEEADLRNSISMSMSVKFEMNEEGMVRYYFPSGALLLNDYFVFIYDNLIETDQSFNIENWRYKITFNYLSEEPISFVITDEIIILNGYPYYMEGADHSALIDEIKFRFDYYTQEYETFTTAVVPG